MKKKIKQKNGEKWYGWKDHEIYSYENRKAPKTTDQSQKKKDNFQGGGGEVVV